MDRGDGRAHISGHDRVSSQGFGTFLMPVAGAVTTFPIPDEDDIREVKVGFKAHRLARVMGDLRDNPTNRINLRETSERCGETEGELRRILRALRALGVIEYAPWFTEPRVIRPDWRPRATPGGQTWKTVNVLSGPHSTPPSTCDN